VAIDLVDLILVRDWETREARVEEEPAERSPAAASLFVDGDPVGTAVTVVGPCGVAALLESILSSEAARVTMIVMLIRDGRIQALYPFTHVLAMEA
jgi:hypothetical protein